MRQEFNPDVLDIVPQPCTIPFIAPNGASYKYTPDFLVYYRAHTYKTFEHYPKPVLAEIKPESMWRENWRKWLPKWKAAWRYAREEGWCFHIYDEAHIRGQALDNMRFLRRFQRMQFPEIKSRKILDTVRISGAIEFHQLLSEHFPEDSAGQGISHIWHLLSTRRIICDIHYPLSNNTELWIPDYE